MRIARIMLAIALVFPALTGITGCAGLVVGGAAATGAAMVHDRRTAGTVLEDQSIELKIRNALFRDERIRKQTHINVTSFNNIVLLSGEASSDALKQRAGSLARGVEKVRRVHNEVQIAAPSSMMSRSNDTVLTAKVKTAMIGLEGLEDFDFTRVKVVTENGIVFLMGLLRADEAGAVTDAARRVRGVRKVVKLFEPLS